MFSKLSTIKREPKQQGQITIKTFNTVTSLFLLHYQLSFDICNLVLFFISALISRFKYSPDSVLALYKSIFVESNEVINKSIQVVPQSMSDIMAILDTPSQNLRPENEKATSTANTESNIFVKVAPDSNIAAGSDRRILPLLSQFLLKLQ